MTIGEEGDSTVQLVACDPPYNIRYEKPNGNADYDRLIEDYMDKCVAFMTSYMKKGARGHVFCSTLQFGMCYKAFTAPK